MPVKERNEWLEQSKSNGDLLHKQWCDKTHIKKKKYQIKRQSDSESSDVIRRTSEDAKESEHTVCYTKENCDQQFWGEQQYCSGWFFNGI